MRINARDDVGDSGYGVLHNVEMEKIEFLEHDINFIRPLKQVVCSIDWLRMGLMRITNAVCSI